MSLFSCNIKDLLLKGKIENQNATGTPIVVVQGGPGMSYEYMLNSAKLIENHPVIFYNPLAYDDKSEVINQSLLNFDHFTHEINQIRQQLNLSECILMSHSAGTIISLDYLLKGANGVLASIFISPVFSLSYYQSCMDQLLLTFPEQARTTIKRGMQGERVDPIDHMEAMAHFYQNHMCRLTEWPDTLINASKNINQTMLSYLWGANDFDIKGIWKDFERLEELSHLTIPTLLLSGEFDFINHESCQYYAKYLPDPTVATIKNASHTPNYENPEDLQNITTRFLNTILC